MNITDPKAENDLVFMMDALDIWLQLSPDTLAERFYELNATVVTGADKICWPNEGESVSSWHNRFPGLNIDFCVLPWQPECQGAPPSPVPAEAYGGYGQPRWANSGAVIGSVAEARALYKDLVKMLEEPKWQIESDQGNHPIRSCILLLDG